MAIQGGALGSGLPRRFAPRNDAFGGYDYPHAFAPIAWRAHSKSYRYRLRCPRCGLQAVVAAVRHERAVEMWNEAVVTRRDVRRRGTR